jgi:uncharacterized membrane protein YccC
MYPSMRAVAVALGCALAASVVFSYAAWSDGEDQRAMLCRDALERRGRAEAAYLGSTVAGSRSGWASPLEDAYVRALTDVRSYCR